MRGGLRDGRIAWKDAALTARTRTESVETLIKRRKAQDAKLRSALAAEDAAIAKHQARRAELLALLGEAPTPNGNGVALEDPMRECADCGQRVPRYTITATNNECPACFASPFEEAR